MTTITRNSQEFILKSGPLNLKKPTYRLHFVEFKAQNKKLQQYLPDFRILNFVCYKVDLFLWPLKVKVTTF